MTHITIRYRRDGSIVAEQRAENIGDTSRDIWDDTDLERTEFAIGDAGYLHMGQYVGPSGWRQKHGATTIVALVPDPDGTGNDKQTRGWDGTTDNIASYGLGWRVVEESRPLTRGHGWRVVFSAAE